MVNKVIGIDPGATGALAIVGKDYLVIYPFKKTNGLIYRTKDIIENLGYPSYYPTYLEEVHSFPGQGVSATFTFGVNVGRIQGMILAEDGEWIPVTPMKWQKELGLTGPYPTKALRKQAHLKKAKELFPNYMDYITLDTADAVLIAEYGYRNEIKEVHRGI